MHRLRAAFFASLSGAALLHACSLDDLSDLYRTASVDASPPMDASEEDVVPTLDGAADGGDGGSADAGPPSCQPDTCERVVFVTKAQLNGAMGGVADADVFCTLEGMQGNARVKGRQYVAWVSTSTTPAGERHVHSNAKYILSDEPGTVVAANWTSLLGGLTHQIDRDHSGGVHNASVWTGTLRDGGWSGNDCKGWTTADGSVTGARGSSSEKGTQWTFTSNTSCNEGHRLYCVEK